MPHKEMYPGQEVDHAEVDNYPDHRYSIPHSTDISKRSPHPGNAANSSRRGVKGG